jgi:hypothetical protein
MPSPPLRLSDEQVNCLMTIAAPLPPKDRAAFLTLVADRLRGIETLGDGVVARTARECVRKFWRAPTIDDEPELRLDRANGR